MQYRFPKFSKNVSILQRHFSLVLFKFFCFSSLLIFPNQKLKIKNSKFEIQTTKSKFMIQNT